MKFYISPDQRQNVEHKIDLMFKHLENKPTVTFGMVEKVISTTIRNYGWDGFYRSRARIEAIKVQIEDIKTSDWVLVATVDYASQKLLMCDSMYFKDIPSQYGLNYTKCDHCGSEHKHRIESHILFNEDTGEWMQVGSTCINKMLDGGKYLNGLMLKLYNVINIYGGCEADDWHHGYWMPSKAYLKEGIQIVSKGNNSINNY